MEQYDALLLDLDGVVYRGNGPVRNAVESLAAAVAAGMQLGFVTNNASRPSEVVAEHLTRIGVPATPAQVVTSAQVGAELLGRTIAPGSRVLAVGGPGVGIALRSRGFEVVVVRDERDAGRSDPEIAASVVGVLQGFGPDVSWRDLAVAAYAVERGATWVATNTDRTIPRADGIAPGNGTLVDAVTEATGVVPPSAGKPGAEMMQIAATRLGSERPLVVGDRLDTDIRGAGAAGFDSLLVLTGVSTVADVLAAEPIDRPTYVAPDLSGLSNPLERLDDPAGGQAAQLVRACWDGTDPDLATAAQRLRSLGWS